MLCNYPQPHICYYYLFISLNKEAVKLDSLVLLCKNILNLVSLINFLIEPNKLRF
ncbi:hypothetical protein CULT_2700001 [[Clostridium] ultunense Esp]|nr:hypothetical protein CULT_2700001 [[Clostridium] ultunense Esp]